MQLPDKIVCPFAKDGEKRPIPVPSQIATEDGAASFVDGFPPLTMLPIEEGGVPPSGLDFNGLFYTLSANAQWAAAGGTYQYDSDFAENPHTGGYPEGAVVRKNDNTGFWVCLVDGNITNPDLGGEGWIDFYLLGALGMNSKFYFMGQI